MTNVRQFLTDLRTFIPEAEEFLLDILPKEDLSQKAQTHLQTINDKLNHLKSTALQSPVLVKFYLRSALSDSKPVKAPIQSTLPEFNESLFRSPSPSPPPSEHSNSSMISPPSPFRSDQQQDHQPQPSLNHFEDNSSESRFSLRINDTSDSNENSQASTHPIRDNELADTNESFSTPAFYPIFNVEPANSKNATSECSTINTIEHILINSGSENSISSSPNILHISDTKQASEDTNRKRKRKSPSKKRCIKRRKVTYITSDSSPCIISSDNDENITSRQQETNSDKLAPIGTESISGCGEIGSDTTTLVEEVSTVPSHPIYNAITSDNSKSPFNTESSENGGNSPRGFSSTEKVDKCIESNITPEGCEDGGNTEEPDLVGKGTDIPSPVSSNNELEDCNTDFHTNSVQVDLTKDKDLTQESNISDSPTEKTQSSSASSSSLTSSSADSSSSTNSPTSSPSHQPDTSPTRTRNEEISDDAHNDDIIDLHPNQEEDAFPSSLSDCDTATLEPVPDTIQLTDTGECAKISKQTIWSRLGSKNNSDSVRQQPFIQTSRKSYDIIHQSTSIPNKCDICSDIILITQEKIIQCRQCLAKYTKNDEFDSHFNIGNDAFCPYCRGVSFKTVCKRNMHIRSTHKNPNLCDSCLRNVGNNSESSLSLDSQSSPKHDIDGSYGCSECSKRFKSKLELDKHRQIRHEKAKKPLLTLQSRRVFRPNVKPLPRILRTSSNELNSNSEITQNKNAATHEFDLISKKQTNN